MRIQALQIQQFWHQGSVHACTDANVSFFGVKNFPTEDICTILRHEGYTSDRFVKERPQSRKLGG